MKDSVITQDLNMRPKKSLLTELYNAIKINPPAIFSLIVVLMYVFIGIFGEMIAPYEFDEMGVGKPLEKPNWNHFFGTDEFGRDVFSRVLAGGKISLRIGVLVVGIAGIFGSIIGMISAYVGGWVDEAIMRVTDVFLSVPDLVMALVIATALGAGMLAGLKVGFWKYPKEIFTKKEIDKIFTSNIDNIKRDNYINSWNKAINMVINKS